MKNHILVIDDEANIRELLEGFLSANGYRVTTAGSVHEALRLTRQTCPDLVISDLQLEDGDGFEMIRQIKGTCPGTPVILLTGVLFDEDVVDKVLKDTVSCYLEKTTPLAKIGQTVKALLETAGK